MPDRPGSALGVGLVGTAFMGRVHSQAWRTVNHVFDVPLTARMVALCGQDPARTASAARQLGWRDAGTDWRALVERDDIDLLDVCTPGDSHAEIAIAALEAGKHVLCEKPLANSVEEAEAMAAAAERARAHGVRSMVAFNYRRVPALALARDLVGQGRLGNVRHVRATYLQDWLVDPDSPLTWRLQRERAGSGALGDLGAHAVDLAQFVTGARVGSVCALTETFVDERPLSDGDGRGQVTVDDAALFLARLDSGAVASFEATRMATGRKNALRVEVNGSDGSLAFDFERMNELQLHDGAADPATAGFARVLVTEPTHPYAAAWWPPGHGLGYEHSFVHEVRDLLEAIVTGTDPEPSFADGLQVQRVLEAVERSAGTACWQKVGS